MNRSGSNRHAVGTAVAAAAVLTVTLASAQSPANCSRVGDREERLACYDRLFPPVAPSGTAGTEAKPNAVATRPAVAAVVAVPTTPESRFGLSLKARAAVDVEQISSQIVGEVTGWVPGTRLRLANGQVWAIDESSRTGGYALRDPKARVVEGSFGGYYIEIEGVSKSPRVKRVE